MRKPAAALAATVLGAIALAGPPAAAAPVQEDAVRCGASATSEVCALLDDLAAQLAPIQPVLDLAGPVVSALGGDAAGLAALSDSRAGVPTADVLGTIADLQGALDLLPAGVTGLLPGGLLAELGGTLDDLAAALAPVTEPVLGEPEARDGGSPTVMPTPAPSSSPSPAAGPAASPTTPVTAAERGGSASAAAAGSGAPAVPDGGVLTLGPLAPPDFGFASAISTSSAARQASGGAAGGGAEAGRGVVIESITATDDGGSPFVVVAILSVFLLAGAGGTQALQARRASRTIPD